MSRLHLSWGTAEEHGSEAVELDHISGKIPGNGGRVGQRKI